VITSVSGGYIKKLGLFGQHRSHLISNIDWTPTLLRFAGYLKCIPASEQTWSGVSQYDMIINNEKQREHLILNVADEELGSASIVMEHSDGNLYKYIVSEPNNPADRWIWSSTKSDPDTWSILDSKHNTHGFQFYSDGKEEFKYSQIVDGDYLFDLTNDVSEFYNLLNQDVPHYSNKLRNEVIDSAMDKLKAFMAKNKYFSTPMMRLHDRFDIGNALGIDDGRFVRPFLNDSHYQAILTNMFIDEEVVSGRHHSEEQKALYFNPWKCPKYEGKYKYKTQQMANKGLIGFDVKHSESRHLEIILSLLFVVGFAVYCFYRYCIKPYLGYTDIKSSPFEQN